MPLYRIETWGNGTFVEITRVADGVTQFLQGEAAATFSDRLEATHGRYTDDDLAEEYFQG